MLYGRIIMNNKLEAMQKEVELAYFTILILIFVCRDWRILLKTSGKAAKLIS
jgi:hypothetical protein